MAKVSVIMPVYNSELTVREALDSALGQSLDEMEIVCIDDGSKDRSKQILTSYAEKYANVRLISQKNAGAGAARNRGIGAASGEFIAFLDADDRYPSADSIKNLYETARHENVKICGGNQLLFWTEHGNTEKTSRDEMTSFHNNARARFTDYGWPFGYQRYIYEKKMLVDNDIMFPTYTLVEDAEFFARAMTLSGEFYGLAEDVYAYRIGTHDATRRAEYVHNFLIMALALLKIADKNGNIRLQRIVIDQLSDVNMYAKIVQLMRSEREYVLTYLDRMGKFMFPDLHDAFEEHFAAEVISKMEKVYEGAIEDVARICGSDRAIVIYGAGIIGRRFASYLNRELGIRPVGYAVTTQNDCHGDVDGIPVRVLEKWEDLKTRALFVIAVKNPALREEMEESLKRMMVPNIYVLQTEHLGILLPLEGLHEMA